LADAPEFPVYLFTGFLDAGKTTFIQSTLEDKRFNKGERTLLLLCEEGEIEFNPESFSGKNVFIRTIEEESELQPERLAAMQHDCRAERILVEYNGMWMLDSFYQAMPEEWAVYQEFLFADARNFLAYNKNMRQLVYDKLKSCELVVFNRFDSSMDKMEFHKIVRGASRRADIAYEYGPDTVEYDDIEDPLPFDVNAPIIKIGDEDYAIWYRDLSENPQTYENKKVQVKCRALLRKKLPKGTFIVGRHVMTCCVQDIQFSALICEWEKADTLRRDSWMILTAKVTFRYHKAYGEKGPVLTYITAEECPPPENPVATFY
jgi:hypothetical protein